MQRKTMVAQTAARIWVFDMEKLLGAVRADWPAWAWKPRDVRRWIEAAHAAGEVRRAGRLYEYAQRAQPSLEA